MYTLVSSQGFFYEDLFPKIRVKEHTDFVSRSFVFNDSELNVEELRVRSVLQNFV